MIKLSDFQKLLALFIAFITAMIICRMLYSGSIRFIFLLWNLFLAWIPYQLSSYLSWKRAANKWKAGVLLAGWLLFFPNALYIITDLVHLETKTNVPIWYDAVLLFASAIVGLLMAFASLYKVEKFFLKKIGIPATNKLIVLCLFMGSFGVYLGRFLRWNSWDIITNPMELSKEIALRFFFPVDYYRTWAITLLFTGLFSLLYFMVKILTATAITFNKSADTPKTNSGR
ncbi:MAG: DUF1361 domain-containing protein [Ferruginibacter sp.]|nr:DUF1361 domain-containing protein [Ferruginibacter sp.]